MMPVSRNAQLVKFFVSRSKNGLGRTKLLKLVYLTDLEARKLVGRPISALEYEWHNHGPFDSDIYTAIEELEAIGLAHTEVINHGSGYVEKRLIDDGGPTPFDLSSAEAEILEYVAARFMAVPLRDLLDKVVYESRPMKAVSARNELLPMDIVDNFEQMRLGFDFERVVRADAEVSEGHFMLGTEVFDGLRAEVARGRQERA